MKNMKRAQRKSQTGILLIEAMVAILIFTIGVIALMGVQAVAMRNTSDSKIRMDAELFADQLLSEMTIDAPMAAGAASVTRLTQRYASAQNGPGYQRWRDRVTAALPGASVDQPVVTVVDATPVAPGSPSMANVTVIVFWRGPKDPPASGLGAGPARRVVATALFN